jgi:type I restriction enzyme S subunit
MHEPPAGWARRSLGDVAEECTGRNSENLSPDNVFGVFKGQGLRPMKDRVRADKLDRYKHVQGGWFAFNPMRINIGSIARNNRTAPVLVSPDYVVFRCREELIAPDFLDHVRAGADWTRFVENAGQGSVRVRIYFDDLARMPLLLPPLAEQRKIAAILSSVDETIEKTEGVIAQLDVVKKAMLEELLTRGIPGRHSRFKQTEVGPIPMEWGAATYGELAADLPAAIQSGPFGSELKHSEFQANGKLVVGIDNVLDGRFSLGANHRISEAKFESLRRFQARPGDLLITVMATVGRCCVVPEDLEPAIITKHVYRLSVDRKKANPYFLLQCLYGIRQLADQVRGSAQGLTRPGLNKSLLLPLLFPIPPLAEQGEIVAIARSLDERSAAEQMVLAQLRLLKEGLAQRLLSGEQRVRYEVGIA